MRVEVWEEKWIRRRVSLPEEASLEPECWADQTEGRYQVIGLP